MLLRKDQAHWRESLETRRKMHIPRTGRHLSRVLKRHGLELELFAGATVLDLGAGMSDLQADLEFEGVEAQVINLEIDTSENDSISDQLVANPYTGIPLKDECVDVVLSTYFFPIWTTNSDDYVEIINETARIIKPGGILSLFPDSLGVSQWEDPWSFERTSLKQGIDLELSSLASEQGWEVRSSPSRSFCAVKSGSSLMKYCSGI